MRRTLALPTLVALQLLATSHACTDVGLQPPDEPPPSVVNDLLLVEGTVCTSVPEDVAFPVKIMVIVDGSGSMQFTDPSAANTTTTINSSGVPTYDANAIASCTKACTKTGTPAATCASICQNPVNPGRQAAVQALVAHFKNNPSVSFSIVRFNGRITINGSAYGSNVGDFTNDESTLNKAINNLSQADITTDYQGALTTAYQVLEKDMVKTSPVERARTKYVVIFFSDGAPNPRCKEGCGNDKQVLPGANGAPGIVVDSWCDVPRDEWCDNFFIQNNAHCKDMTNWYPLMKEPCREYNTPEQIKQKVMEIMSLGDQYSVGEVRLHTAFLFVPSLPKAIQDLMGVEGSSDTRCNTDQDCPVLPNACTATPDPDYWYCFRTGEQCRDGSGTLLTCPVTRESCYENRCKGFSEKLLIDMANWGDGVYRNFSSGQQIDFLSFNYSSVRRPFGMINFIVTNTNSRPGFDSLEVDSDGDGLPDDEEFDAASELKLKMDAKSRDSDGDGYNDKMEYDRALAGFDPGDPKKPEASCSADNRIDQDGDGLNACEEKVIGTDPKIVDSDRDRFPDGLEFLWGTNPLSQDDKLDLDFDGKLSGEEIRIHANPTVSDPKIHANYKYIYQVEKRPERPDLRQCYDFTVRRVRLVQTVEATVAGTLGYNEIMLYFGQGPADDPRDYGSYQAACVRAQYVAGTHGFKFPADGRVVLEMSDFQDLEQLILNRQAAAKDPSKDPCKGAPLP